MKTKTAPTAPTIPTLLRRLEQDYEALLNWAQKRREGFVIRRLDSIAAALDDLAALGNLPTRAEREIALFRKRHAPKKAPKPAPPKPVQRKAPTRRDLPDIAPDRQKPRTWNTSSD